MIESLAKTLDWLHLQRTFGRMPSDDGRVHRLEEALGFLKSPDFIPAESQPAPVQFDSGVNFRFASPRPSAFGENNIAYGRLYRCGERWQERPVILLLHGGGLMTGRKSSLKYRFAYPMIARHCNRSGFNAATLELPYNFQRHPRPPGPLPAQDFLRMAEAVAQAIAEIRALTGRFLAEGCPAVALWGISMGAWLTGLTVCREPRLTAVVMTVPTVHSNAGIVELILGRIRREAWRVTFDADEALDETPFNLTSAQPAIPRNNILLIGGSHDLVCPMKPIEVLWQVWGQPGLWRLPHGHISFMSERGLTERVLNWLRPRMGAPHGPVTPNNAQPALCTGRPDGALFPSRTPLAGRQ
jgi:pimeloyl-ACP methyl ester carboxylesterase